MKEIAALLALQAWLFLLFITYIVYINPQIFGGKNEEYDKMINFFESGNNKNLT